MARPTIIAAIPLVSLVMLLAAVDLPAQEPTAPMPPRRIDFDSEIRPIFERACVSCHGKSRQRQGLRLDDVAALRAGSLRGPVLDHRQPEQSELLRRVTLGEQDEDRMPPKGARLAAAEVERLRAWIIEEMAANATTPTSGGRGHWAYRSPSRPPLPPSSAENPGLRPIDAFVDQKLSEQGLDFRPEAPPAELLRRVSLDLTGLPPDREAMERFLADPGPDAYGRAVAGLLSSPAFGEHWAAMWLDLSRYADTMGYEKDPRRTIWPFRDWLIEALDRDLPYDRFVTEILAGDLLPDANLSTRIATAFHRNTMTNTEGGTDNEEFRCAAVVDRVNTTMSVFMGTTMACAQCHDHKYDPLTTREYYQLFAFFDDTADADSDDDEPALPVPDPAAVEAYTAAEAARAEAERRLDAASKVDGPHFADWRRAVLDARREVEAAGLEWGPWFEAPPISGPDFGETHRAHHPAEEGRAAAEKRGENWRERSDWTDGVVHADLKGDNTAHHLERRVHAKRPVRISLHLGSDDAIRVLVNGAIVLDAEVARGAAPDQELVSVSLPAGESRILLKITNGGGPSGFYFRWSPDDLDAAGFERLSRWEPAAPAAETAAVEGLCRRLAPALVPERQALEKARMAADGLVVARCPVLVELPADRRRRTQIHHRGNFLDRGDEVEPDTPGIFPPMPEAAPRNRLGLAAWLTSPDNPLIARVQVNRIWERLFGIGIVETAEDFGTQGEPPSHPELLDWLAVEFMEKGWSLRRLLEEIVTSRTYRQDSRVDAERLRLDPRNRLLSRAPRLRLTAEVLRDQSLAVAGLLSRKRLGPSVMPHQPEGVWNVIYSGDVWKTSAGPERFRRALYTYWRRTAPYPSMTAFDATSREVCTVRRIRTNTPLQALVTLNDPAFFICAQKIARDLEVRSPDDVAGRIELAFERVLLRRPADWELSRLRELQVREEERLRADPAQAAAIVGEELGAIADEAARVRVGSYVLVANLLMNLDEFLCKD